MRMRGIMLVLTPRCNVKCSYCRQECYYAPILHNDMLLETALRAIKTMKDLANSGFFQVGFYGGEPMIRKDLIKSIIGKNAGDFYIVVTNGTFPFDDYKEIVDLASKKIWFSISYDGKEGDRGGNPELVFENIMKLRRMDVPMRVVITLTQGSIPRFWETIDELQAGGVKNIWFEVQDELDLSNNLLNKIREIIKKAKGMGLSSSLIKEGPCLFRKGESFFVLPNGAIYMCHKGLTEDIQVGNISDPPEKIRAEIGKKSVCLELPSLCVFQRGRDNLAPLFFEALAPVI